MEQLAFFVAVPVLDGEPHRRDREAGEKDGADATRPRATSTSLESRPEPIEQQVYRGVGVVPEWPSASPRRT